MKTTLVTAALCLGLAASASAIDLANAVYSTVSSEGFTNLTDTTFSSAGSNRDLTTIVVVLDYSTVTSLIDSGDLSSATTLFTFSNSNGNSIAVSISGSQSESGEYTLIANIASGSYSKDSGNLLSTTSYDAETGTITFSVQTMDGNNGTRIYAADGTVYWSQQKIRWGKATDGYNQITYSSTDALLAVYAFDSALSSADITSVSAQAAAAVPEPATATLGLLALGALALRRRRA
ncbi:MAG: PEP-CTERM sorting domain-containing protein [Akkermansiaceae bacterium]|nr:PEP-CTERM sorting domain-containing protein [Akkermansiaceae bacterium]